jgi:hypothetical protein
MNVQSTLAVRVLLTALVICVSCSPRLARAGSIPSVAGGSGPSIRMELRPATTREWPYACSLRHPLCSRAAPGTPHRFQLAAMAAADRAWEAITGVLRAPAPEGALGDPWEVYLVDMVEGGSRAVSDERDPVSRFDGESSFALVDRETPADCRLDFALARAIAEGSLWRATPATDIGSARAQSEEVAHLVTPCAPPPENAAAFQTEPWRCIIDPSSEPFDRGASTFVQWVDATFGSEPGSLLLGAWALAPTRTAPAASRWSGAPTTFDVFRASLKGALGRETTFDDALLKFAVARASMDPRPAFAWSVPWPFRARRLTPAEPIAPTGASYVRVDYRGSPRGAKLRLEAQWEDYARMRWLVVKRDAADKTLAVLPVTSTERGTAASMTVEEQDSVDHLLIVILNLGSTEHPFDPDQGEWEPHGWLLTLEGEPALGP